jgi:membrane protein implicated in regulation of membrane protease activity
MRNTIVFIAWTLLLVILLLAGIAFYIVSASDGTATYAQMGYDTGQQFVKVLLVSIVVVVLGKHRGFLPGFSPTNAKGNPSGKQDPGNAT